jgi:hypothetical protein
MEARQLQLFKGKRQRGERLPAPKEIALHIAVADLVRRWIAPGWSFTHLPMGEKRDKATAGRLQRMGVMAGWPDFIFIGPGPVVFFLELKRVGGRTSDEQEDVAFRLVGCGCLYLRTDNLDDAVGALRDLRIVRASVSA